MEEHVNEGRLELSFFVFLSRLSSTKQIIKCVVREDIWNESAMNARDDVQLNVGDINDWAAYWASRLLGAYCGVDRTM